MGQTIHDHTGLNNKSLVRIWPELNEKIMNYEQGLNFGDDRLLENCLWGWFGGIGNTIVMEDLGEIKQWKHLYYGKTWRKKCDGVNSL